MRPLVLLALVVALVVALSCASIFGQCPCSPACVCGCQVGRPCACVVTPAYAPAYAPGAPSAAPAPSSASTSPSPSVGGPPPNYGVVTERLVTERYHRRGKAVHRLEAFAAIGGSRIPDDGALLRLTLFGPEEIRKRVLSDLEGPVFARVKSRVVVKAYPVDHWIVREYGFRVSTMAPTIYIQHPVTGAVLHRQDEYKGPEALVEAVRKADPSYRPEADPNLSTSPSPDLGELARKVPTWAWVGGAILAVLFLNSRKS